MCGISGAFSSQENIHSKQIYDMTQAAKHRGPNDEGYVLIKKNSVLYLAGKDSPSVLKNDMREITESDEKCYLAMGHRRLSILDLSEQGHQPMTKHGLILVFNGEIYNYIELKNVLIESGYNFTSSSDTEVILSAYDLWGKNCVNFFNGMWAIAIYDPKNDLVFCSRDRFGVKPFYYYQDNECFYFASEIKQLLTQISDRNLNKRVLMDYIHFFASDHTDETFFEGIMKLPPSHSLFLSTELSADKRFYIERYYDINSTEHVEFDNKDFYSLFDSAVGIRTRSDVPVGATLSGGLDSSSITSILAQKLSKNGLNPIETFTFAVPGNKYDETEYASLMNSYVKASPNYTQVNNQSNFYEEYLHLIEFHDEPFQSFSIYASWLVMKLAASKNISVLLDGQGADEIFLGYEYFLSTYAKEYIKKYGLKKTIQELNLITTNTTISFFKIIKIIVFFGVPKLRKLIKKFQIKFYVSESFTKEYGLTKQLDEFLHLNNLKDQQYNAIYKSLQSLLKWEDQNSMAFSIETRLPFMDYRIVEKAFQAEFDQLISEGRLKVIIRRFMENNLPDEIRYRKDKIGFYSPGQILLDSIPKDKIDDLFINPRSANIFNMKKITKYFQKNKNFKARYLFFTIETWMRKNDVEFES